MSGSPQSPSLPYLPCPDRITASIHTIPKGLLHYFKFLIASPFSSPFSSHPLHPPPSPGSSATPRSSKQLSSPRRPSPTPPPSPLPHLVQPQSPPRPSLGVLPILDDQQVWASPREGRTLHFSDRLLNPGTRTQDRRRLIRKLWRSCCLLGPVLVGVGNIHCTPGSGTVP